MLPNAGFDIDSLSDAGRASALQATEAVERLAPEVLHSVEYLGTYEDASKRPRLSCLPAKTAQGDAYWNYAAHPGYLGDGAETIDGRSVGLNLRVWELGENELSSEMRGYGGGWLAHPAPDAAYLLVHEYGHVADSWLRSKIGDVAVDNWMASHGREISALSGYAATSPAEGMAECFAEAVTVGRSRAGQCLLRLIKATGGGAYR